MAEGHPEARAYPIGMVWDEVSIVVERNNAKSGTEATLIQMAVSSVLSKDGHKQFTKVMKELFSGP